MNKNTKLIVILIIVGGSLTGLLFEYFISNNGFKLETAIVKPGGYDLVEIKSENQTYVIKEIKMAHNIGMITHWYFKTTNDTDVREVATYFAKPRINDVVILTEKVYSNDCNVGLNLILPDDFSPVYFSSMRVFDFDKSQLPQYYTDRYNIKTDFSICNEMEIRLYSSLLRDGNLVSSEEPFVLIKERGIFG